MKNMKRVLVLIVILSALLCVQAFAADGTIAEIKDLADGVTVADYKDAESFTLSYSNTVDNGMYLVLVLKDQLGSDLPTASDILYINQETATATGVTFGTVYPSEIESDESYIYLSGTNLSGLTLSGTIVPNGDDVEEGLKGDVDVDGDVDADDVTMLLRHVSKIEYITDPVGLANGEVTNDTSLDSDDVTKLLRYVSKIITTLD